MSKISLILVLFIVVVFLGILYVKKLEHFEIQGKSMRESVFIQPTDSNLEPVTFTYNTDMSNVVKIIDNINVDGRYLNVFQCKPVIAQNGDKYKPLGQYMTITDSNLVDITDDEKKKVCLNLLVKGGLELIEYSMIWSSQFLSKPPQQDFSIWRPIPPSGYKNMCDIIVPGFSKPSQLTTPIICLPDSVVENSPVLKDILLKVDYEAINMNYTLHCWNTSSHNFFRCANDNTASKNATPTQEIEDMNAPLVTSKEVLLNNIFNIKDENMKKMGNAPETSNSNRIRISSA